MTGVTTGVASPVRFSISSTCLPSPPPLADLLQTPTSRRSTDWSGAWRSTAIVVPSASAEK